MVKFLDESEVNTQRYNGIPEVGQALTETEQFYMDMFCCVTRSRKSESLQVVVRHLLKAGCTLLRMKTAVVLEPISSSIYKIVFSYSQSDELYVGKHLNGAKYPYLASILASSPSIDNPLGTKVIKEEGNSFIGAKLGSTRHQDYVLYFEELSAEDDLDAEKYNLHIQLLAEGVAFMVDQSNVMALHKEQDIGISAKGTVRSLEEYSQQAKIPETYGVPARVLDSLERRIGEHPLSISDVAQDLNLSKRTLQRRLQQQDVNFADLRDNVRFHYSINYLLKGHQSIDAISTLLDFSDRTSFTNAFKRWTGLSPSNFRKLFRDYV